MKRKTIVTMPPYAPFIDEVLKHDKVKGIRLNTVMPVKEKLKDLLKRFKDKAEVNNKELWVDLKCRQLRIKNYGIPPFTEIEISHDIEVFTPCDVYFSDRYEKVTLLEVDKNRLIMQEGPRRVVGPGESITITHPTLKISGYLTETDKRYIEAGNKVGVNNYMLSFVEKEGDIDEFKRYAPNADIISKIESSKGISYVSHGWDKTSKLMAARGDLYMEIEWPHNILPALEKILEKDPDAIVASRIFTSLSNGPEPSCADIGDADNLLRMGYKTFMFGDEICLNRKSIIGALNLYAKITERYDNEK
ncbi:MAG: pyruvate kinase [archaeon]